MGLKLSGNKHGAEQSDESRRPTRSQNENDNSSERTDSTETSAETSSVLTFLVTDPSTSTYSSSTFISNYSETLYIHSVIRKRQRQRQIVRFLSSLDLSLKGRRMK